MKDYSKVTALEYMKKKKAIMESIGRETDFCDGVNCEDCPFVEIDNCVDIEMNFPEKAIEIVMEYKFPVDWKKVTVDTPIYVRSSKKVEFIPRYFAKFENGKVCAWNNGSTSFTAGSEFDYTCWDYAKLKEEVINNE